MCRAAEEQLHHTVLQIKNQTFFFFFFCNCRRRILRHALLMVCSVCAELDLIPEIITWEQIALSHTIAFRSVSRCVQPSAYLQTVGPALTEEEPEREAHNFRFLHQGETEIQIHREDFFVSWDISLHSFYDPLLTGSQLLLSYLKQKLLEVPPPPQWGNNFFLLM